MPTRHALGELAVSIAKEVKAGGISYIVARPQDRLVDMETGQPRIDGMYPTQDGDVATYDQSNTREKLWVIPHRSRQHSSRVGLPLDANDHTITLNYFPETPERGRNSQPPAKRDYFFSRSLSLDTDASLSTVCVELNRRITSYNPREKLSLDQAGTMLLGFAIYHRQREQVQSLTTHDTSEAFTAAAADAFQGKNLRAGNVIGLLTHDDRNTPRGL